MRQRRRPRTAEARSSKGCCAPLATMATLDGGNPAWPYIDLIYQKDRNSGITISLYFSVYICVFVYIG